MTRGVLAIAAVAGCVRAPSPRPPRAATAIEALAPPAPAGAPPAEERAVTAPPEERAAPTVAAPPAVAPRTLAAARTGLRADPRLDAIAAVTAEAATRGYVVPTAALRDATLARLGSDLLPYVITARGAPADAEAQLALALTELRAAAALEAVGVGEATGATGRVMALVATPAPTVTVAARRAGDRVALELAWRWPAPPAAYLTTPSRTRKIDVTHTGDRVIVEIRCRGGKAGGFATDAALEIDAGARLVASVPAVCGRRRPDDAPLDVRPPARTAVEIEERLFALVNQARAAAGHAPLAWDADAQRMARDHAADMASGGFIGHVGSGGATLTARVRGHALRAVETFENVGRAGGPGEAHAAFLASPGHRANLMAVGARRGAIDVAFDPRVPGDFYVVEVFFEPAR